MYSGINYSRLHINQQTCEYEAPLATLKGQYDLADIIETEHVSTATPGDFKANNRPDHAAEKRRRKKKEREREFGEPGNRTQCLSHIIHLIIMRSERSTR